ncbi:MAG: hypothetical protein ACHQ7H_19900 [Candidatus Rokuibacteriota bacterium]
MMFLLSLACYIYSWVIPLLSPRTADFWSRLHGAVFPLFVWPFAAMVVVSFLRNRKPSAEPAPEESTLEGFAQSIPGKVWILAALVVIFASGTFFAGFAALSQGSPRSDNGLYYLDYNGRRVRELSDTEFRRLVGYETRMVSGHIMVFSMVGWTYFSYREPLTRQREGSAA